MKKIIRLTESDLTRIVKRVMNEQKEQDLITEGLGDLIKKIKSKFSDKKEEALENELKDKLNIDSSSSKEEVKEKIKDFFEKRKKYVGDNKDRLKDYILHMAERLGTVFKLFTYLVLITGATYVSDNDPITFLAIATYMFLQTRAKIGNKEFKFKN